MAKKRIANYVFLPGVSSSTNAYPNAYSLLSANKTFIIKESTAYIASKVAEDTAQNLYPAAVALLTSNKQFILDEISAWIFETTQSSVVGDLFYGYEYGPTEISKCKRDMGYLIDALIHDLRYGGNEQVSYVASQYYQSGVVQVINVPVEVAIQSQLWELISDYILTATPYVSQQSPVSSTQNTSGAPGEISAIAWALMLSTIASNVMSGGLSTLPAIIYSDYNFAEYTYDSSKCERDVGYIFDAYLNDLKYGGNAKTRTIASRYWDGDVPQILGDRKTEIDTHTFIEGLISNIFSASSYTPLQQSYPRQLLNGLEGEAGAANRITSLVNLVNTVIADGPSSIPSLVNGVTTIRLQGQYTLDKLLLITNATTNQILYNFSDPTASATVSFSSTYTSNSHSQDEDFVRFLEVADYVTTITLNADTSNSSTSDDIQIFVEGEEQKIRPYDFGTDAIERMRVAQPQSMLDADFEYGLQPTKWQAIGIARGYPSVYEVPGSDTPVISVITDASTGTGGVGASLITVTTQSAHGFTVGTPITIRSLANTVSGFNRAEGTFIVLDVPSPTSFTYYASAKVGSIDGQILATTYTQLRKAGFYTGASIGSPTISVYSNGQTSSFTSKFVTPSGSSQIAVAGALPALGVPLSSAGINSGTQITGTVGTGGQQVLAVVDSSIEIGDTIISVNDTTGILEGMAIDNGSGTAIFVTEISGNDVALNGPMTVAKGGTTETYLNVIGTNVIPGGSGADFSVERVNGQYTNLLVTTPGVDYVTNSRIKILGSDLGGVDGDNDIIVKVASVIGGKVETVNHAGAAVLGNGIESYLTSGTAVLGKHIVSFTFAGTPNSPVGPFTNLIQSSTSGTGAGATFNVTDAGAGAYSVSLSTIGSGYIVGEVVTILGSVLEGADGVNNLTVTVDTIDGSGGILTFTHSGVANSPIGPFLGVTPDSNTGSGTGATFDINDSGSGAYLVALNTDGQGFNVGDELTILGSQLSGSNGVNDIVITITAVTSLDIATAISQSSTTGAGANATFNVSLDGLGGYSVTVVDPGNSYQSSDQVVILGSLLDGVDGTNDLTISITTVSSLNIASGIFQSSTDGVGTGASFNVSLDGAGNYNVTRVLKGTDYQVGDTITILGSLLDGTDITNDLTITVSSISGGAIDIATIQSGTSVSGERSYTGLAQSTTTGSGANSVFNVQTNNGEYDVTITSTGDSYVLGEEIVILGSVLGGQDGVNDLTITVVSAGVGGSILTFSSAGLPSSINATFNSLIGTNIAPGVNASFDITRSVGSYSVQPNLGGSGYAVNDVIKIDGTDIGGSDVLNDATITVTGVDVGGVITNATIVGTAVGGANIAFWSAVSISEPTIGSIANSTSITTVAIATIQVTWPTYHGLVPGMSILVDITSSGTNHLFAKGPFYIEEVPNLNSIRYTARTNGIIDTATALTGIVYARPQSFFVHRPFDGGVQLGTGGPQHGSQAIRMSKKYIRYQSGKGVMYTTGALFAPSYNLQAATASGTSIGSYIQFTTDDVDHGLQIGGKVRISGVDTTGFNGEYTVVSIQTERIFTVQAQSTLGNRYGYISSNAQVSILNWHGSTVRAGTFDEQNGMFWQYNGKELSVVRRSSTFQLAGVADIEKDTNLVTGTNTRFRDQIKAGDKIVIKGMTHVVTSVPSQTKLYVTPDYRGAKDCVGSKICLVQELVVPQSQFNLDKLDGTGPSGYNLDITKMQMIGMQWSWYGAGFIDFMLRGSDGNYVFAHRIRNSNVNTEAYMRTGNMPVRYEVHNEGASSKLRESITATQTTIPLVDATMFPDESGYIYVDNEVIAFTGKNRNTLTGCTRSASLPQFTGGAPRLFRAGAASTHEVNTGVILISNTITPIISHWGSAFLTDGLFDEDRGYIFNYASTGVQASTTKQTAFLIRLAPSVSNAQVGDLGEKELINRAQLLLQAIEVTSDAGAGGLVVEGILNPQNYPTDPTAITWSALNTSAAGGQPSFAQVAPGGSVSWSGGATTTNATATTTATLSGTATVPNNALFTTISGSNTLYVTKDSWDTLGATTGFAVDASETRFPSGTTITSIAENPSPVATTIGLITGNATIPPSPNFKTAAGVNFLYFTQASWTALNGQIGTAVYSTDFPAGTTVTNVTGPAVAAGQSYYTVTFSNNSLVIHNPVRSTIATYYTIVSGGTATIYFNPAQTYAPYVVGEVITVSGNAGVPQVNGTRTVTACTTQYVQFTGIGGNFNGSSTGSVVNNTSLNFASFSVTGQANVGSTSMNFTQSSWTALPVATAVVGRLVNDPTKFASGTQISTISSLKTFNGVNYYTVTFNNTLLTAQSAGSSLTFDYIPYYVLTLSKTASSNVNFGTTVPFTPSVLSANSSFLYFTKASWETLVNTYNAGIGTTVADVDKFPSGTSIQSISVLSAFAGTQYYRVNFTQSSVTTIAGGSNVTFQFGQPPYALPGETVFSFISTPGGSNSLDLSALKELTNTTLGGRGTYPNGPDVLAINVYKTSGTAVSSNIIIRWGEAQA
jgi:hypothetical protein